MEVTIAVGHFCDTHGPCVILCTDRAKVVPEEPPPSLRVPVCEACQSLDSETIYACQDENSYYVSTRTSLKPDTARLLKDAVLRSLSVEVVQEEGKDSGTMYFGDNKRGHVISHVFDVKDTMARGFKRKYCFVVLAKYQMPLLHHYEFIEQNLTRISKDIQEKADKVNLAEQSKNSQRQMSQARGFSKTILRSLISLADEPNIFAHLHMWFVFLLRAEIYKSIEHNAPECPVDSINSEELRRLHNEMPEKVFETVCYCILTGIKIADGNLAVVGHLAKLLPKRFVLPVAGKTCNLSRTENIWTAEFDGTLPKTLPSLYTLVKAALANKDIPKTALTYHLMSLVMRWFNISCVLSWAPSPCEELIRSLEVRKCDMPLLSYWIPQSNACVKLCETDWFRNFDSGNPVD